MEKGEQEGGTIRNIFHLKVEMRPKCTVCGKGVKIGQGRKIIIYKNNLSFISDIVILTKMGQSARRAG